MAQCSTLTSVGEYWGGIGSVALADATDVDSVARAVLRELMAGAGVQRAGMALTEGGGRRLRFLSTDSSDQVAPAWRHIDAYDDVPLTVVVRTGEPVLGNLDDFQGRYAALIAEQREIGTAALAAMPLAGIGSPLGGLVIFYDRHQDFTTEQRDQLVVIARVTAEAVRRVRGRAGRAPADAAAEAPGVAGVPRQTASLLLESDPRAAGAARHFLREVLDEWEISGDPVDAAELCLSELVTNAVIHAGTSSELTLSHDDDGLTVIVRDLGGSSRPGDADSTVHMSEDEDPLRVFGRGLVLVDALAARWGSERDATGTTSWFVVALDDDRSAAS